MNWKSSEIGVYRLGVARVDSVYSFKKEVRELLVPFLEEKVQSIEAEETSKVTAIEVEDRRVLFTSIRELDPSQEDSNCVVGSKFVALPEDMVWDLKELCAPNTRFERELEMRDPVLLEPSVRLPYCVKGLWAIRDKRTDEIKSFCLSEVAALAVSAHSQHFSIEYQEGPYEIPDGSSDPLAVGRFRKVLGDD